MGARFKRHKPRHLLASLAYKLNRLLPTAWALDLWLDLEWISWRLAHENAIRSGYLSDTGNPFLLNGLRAGDRVLDLGCGNGRIAGQVAQVAAEVVGIDHDLASIEQARRSHPGVTFVSDDAEQYLRTTADPFDVIIMSHILEHLDDPVSVLGLSRRVDRVYVEVPDFEASHLNQVRLLRNRSLLYSDNDHVAEFDRAELEALFADNGLSIVASEFTAGVMRYWITRSTHAPGTSPAAHSAG